MAERSESKVTTSLLSKLADYFGELTYKIKNGEVTIRFKQNGEKGFWIKFWKKF